jgi:hypothetical protein
MTSPVVGTKNDGQINSGSTATITLTNAPSAGGIVVVTAALFSGDSTAGPSCSATGGSGIVITERVDTIGTSSFTLGVAIWTVEYSSAPSSLTIGFVGATGVFAGISCINVTDQNATYFDVAGSGSGTSTTPVATGMGDLTDATDLVIGCMTRGGTTGTIDPAANWTQIVEIDEANTIQTLNSIQRTPGSTGAFDPAWTISGSDTWVAGGLAIKGTAGGGGSNSIAWIRA